MLTGSVYQPDLGPNQTADLFGAEYAEHAADIARRISNEIGMLDLDRLFEQFPRLKYVDELARRHRFHHWELAFADLFYGEAPEGRVREGFDLVLGNPPWVKVEWEERLRAHFQFQNEKKLFLDVHNETLFSINVYGSPLPTPAFGHIANLFVPATVDVCFDHDGRGPIPGIKDDEHNWNVAGHSHRLIEADERALATFASLYDVPGTPPIRERDYRLTTLRIYWR